MNNHIDERIPVCNVVQSEVEEVDEGNVTMTRRLTGLERETDQGIHTCAEQEDSRPRKCK